MKVSISVDDVVEVVEYDRLLSNNNKQTHTPMHTTLHTSLMQYKIASGN